MCFLHRFGINLIFPIDNYLRFIRLLAAGVIKKKTENNPPGIVKFAGRRMMTRMSCFLSRHRSRIFSELFFF